MTYFKNFYIEVRSPFSLESISLFFYFSLFLLYTHLDLVIVDTFCFYFHIVRIFVIYLFYLDFKGYYYRK